MLIKRIHIQNFRSIRDLTLELSPTTVLIGPNNAGKTSILEAIHIALTRRWGQRGTGFTEYDVHLPNPTSDPKTSGPVVIELDFQESGPDDWSEDLRSDLNDITQVDPKSGLASIFLRVSCAWDASESNFVPKWEFLNSAREAVSGRGARNVNLSEFFQYLPVFYLDAVRDAADEFSTRSQFWNKLLRSITIPSVLEKRAERVLDLLNSRLLEADPKLDTLATTLSGISTIAAGDQPGEAQLRMVPLRAWDLLSRAEVIYQSEAEKPWLPLARHGQGIQSLSVMFLFRAFVEQLMTEIFKPGSTAVLALEEPETHLHPQAARALWDQVSLLPGQKVITTHSPYFLQRVPFRDLRIIRLEANGTSVVSLPAQFSVSVPYIPEIDPLLNASVGKLSYELAAGKLVVRGKLTEPECRSFFKAYHGHADRLAINISIRKLQSESLLFIPDSELEDLETFARRIRGEILFARRWFLVEGQSEYNLSRGLAIGLGYDLDSHGVSVIDFQNNGSPGCFASLARALRIPWCAIFDGDQEGERFRQQILSRDFTPAETDARCTKLAAQNLEHQLVADDLQPELKQALTRIGVPNAGNLTNDELIVSLENNKSSYSAVLGQMCAEDSDLAGRMPEAFRTAIQSLQGLE